MRRSQLCQPFRVLQVWPEQVSVVLATGCSCLSLATACTEGSMHMLSELQTCWLLLPRCKMLCVQLWCHSVENVGCSCLPAPSHGM